MIDKRFGERQRNEAKNETWNTPDSKENNRVNKIRMVGKQKEHRTETKSQNKGAKGKEKERGKEGVQYDTTRDMKIIR